MAWAGLRVLPAGAVSSLAEQNRARVAEARRLKPYLSNGLKRPLYLIEGAQVSAADVKAFIAEFPPTFDEALGWKKEFIAAGALDYYGRLKSAESLLGKMQGRFSKGFTLDAVNDVAGVRAIVASRREQTALVDWLYGRFEIVAHLNYVSQDLKTDGYRAEHFTVRAQTGRLVEIQVLTQRQMSFAHFTHDRLYKSQDASLKNDAEVLAYLKQTSQALYERDVGLAAPRAFPKPPKKLKDQGLIYAAEG